ncbi:MAG: hypothetical protein ACTSP9_06810 [Promethearchaeota archaeon]
MLVEVLKVGLIEKIPNTLDYIGFDAEEINNLREKISKNLKNFEYCKLKPQNQNYNQAEIMKVFNDLDIDPLIDEALKNMTKMSISLA